MRKIVTLAFLLLGAVPVSAKDLTVVTWNLGWHLSNAEAKEWIAKCGAPFSLSSTSGLWEPSAMGTPGWELEWGRDAPIKWDISVLPPCDVFQTPIREIVPATLAAYEQRARQIEGKLRDIDPDVIAFQEVSGEAAVREVLPNDGADYGVCTFEGYKVQRLAIAWKLSAGREVGCAPYKPLSLPLELEKDQPRPGIALTLDVDGQVMRFLSVHLKSSCVSPLQTPDDQLDGNEEACQILQKQVAPLEAWLEDNTKDTDRIVLLGDFNRNLGHENVYGGDVRTDGGDPTEALGSGVKVRKLLPEVNDGAPPASKLTLLEATCPINTASQEACNRVKTEASREDIRLLARWENLGCRNPVGLDHILVGAGLRAGEAEKVAIGRLGRTLGATAERPNPLLSISDHCPLVAKVSG